MKITPTKLQAFISYQDMLEEELAKIARDFAALTGERIRGHLDSFSVWHDHVYVSFRDSYQGGWDDYTIKIPFSAFDTDLKAAAEEALAEKKRRDREAEEEVARRAKQLRRQQYEALKEEFENADAT